MNLPIGNWAKERDHGDISNAIWVKMEHSTAIEKRKDGEKTEII